MTVSRDIVARAKDLSRSILQHEVPKEIVYHSLEHTEDVVAAAMEIGINSDLSEDEIEILEMAAWFHDVGFSKAIENHEDCSAEIALDFFSREKYDDLKASRVVGCILATKMPQSPKTRVEEVICDADLLHLATDKYFQRAELLLKELRETQGKEITDREWLKLNESFIEGHEYFTDYTRKKYAGGRQKNLNDVKKKLYNMKAENEVEELQEKVRDLKKKMKKAKELKPTRGIETMFRLTSKNHLDLSAMADNKANIMISINSIILSVLLSVLIRKLEEYPHLTIPALFMTAVCLITIVFSILATRPNVTRGKFSKEDINKKKTNLLFFGNFHSMSLNDYEWGMKEMLKDADYLYSSLIRDIYFLGVVLGKKYRLLRISYTIFMFGIILSVVSFLIAQLFFQSPYPY